jgi:hypothetical protein
MDHSLRHLAPRDHDRISELYAKYPCDISKLANQIQVIKLLKDAKKYKEILEKIEKMISKTAGYNFILRNIPDYGELSETGRLVKIGYSHMRETLEQFGSLDSLEIVKSTVYARFDNPGLCHSLVNNMMMGGNIITSTILV